VAGIVTRLKVLPESLRSDHRWGWLLGRSVDEQLALAESLVHPRRRHQLLVSTALHDAALVKHQNSVCGRDGR